MKEENIRFNIGDIVYAIRGKNRISNDYGILKQKVEAVLLEVNVDGWINDVSYVLTDDLSKDRSTKQSGVFATLEEALNYANKDKELNPEGEE